MTQDTIEKLKNRKFISESEADQIVLCVLNAWLRGPESSDMENALLTKIGEWADTTRFEQARLDQVLSGKLFVRLSTDRRKLEFHAPLEGDVRLIPKTNPEPASLGDPTASPSEPFLWSPDPTDGEDTLQ
jgi:hypothetical protein